MIRKLNADDRAQAESLLSQDRLLNLYMLSNMAQLGFEDDHCEFWGDLTESTIGAPTLRGILNRYMNGWTVYGQSEAGWRGLAALLDQHAQDATRLQDNPGGVESLLPYLECYKAERLSVETLMTLNADDLHAQNIIGAEQVRVEQELVIRRANEADLNALVDFYADAGDMRRSRAAVARPLSDLRIWLAEADGEILSAALTNAELPDAAMIGGVYTRPQLRGRGLGRAVCSALCAELLAEKKQPVLYWKTPAAGAVYRRLGFHSIGQWRSIWLRRC